MHSLTVDDCWREWRLHKSLGQWSYQAKAILWRFQHDRCFFWCSAYGQMTLHMFSGPRGGLPVQNWMSPNHTSWYHVAIGRVRVLLSCPLAPRWFVEKVRGKLYEKDQLCFRDSTWWKTTALAEWSNLRGKWRRYSLPDHVTLHTSKEREGQVVRLSLTFIGV